MIPKTTNLILMDAERDISQTTQINQKNTSIIKGLEAINSASSFLHDLDASSDADFAYHTNLIIRWIALISEQCLFLQNIVPSDDFAFLDAVDRINGYSFRCEQHIVFMKQNFHLSKDGEAL